MLFLYISDSLIKIRASGLRMTLSSYSFRIIYNSLHFLLALNKFLLEADLQISMSSPT